MHNAAMIFCIVVVLLLVFAVYVLFRTVQAHDEQFDKQNGINRRTAERIRTVELQQTQASRHAHYSMQGVYGQINEFAKELKTLKKGNPAEGVEATEDGNTVTFEAKTYKAASAQGWPTLSTEDGTTIARINPKFVMEAAKVDMFHIDDCEFKISISKK